MATIKCKYHKGTCDCQCGAWCEPEGYIDFSDYVSNGQCKSYERIDNPTRYNDFSCRWHRWQEIRFEKTVKSYEYNGYYLQMGSKYIDGDLIDYLEIDGEVIISEGE